MKKEEMLKFISDINSEFGDEYGWGWKQWKSKKELESIFIDEVFNQLHDNWVELDSKEYERMRRAIRSYVKNLRN